MYNERVYSIIKTNVMKKNKNLRDRELNKDRSYGRTSESSDLDKTGRKKVISKDEDLFDKDLNKSERGSKGSDRSGGDM
jgi:hypothetical protein